MNNIAGSWVGEVTGTNTGQLLIDVEQKGQALTGVVRLNDQVTGPVVFKLAGTTNGQIVLKLTPTWSFMQGVVLPPIDALAELKQNGDLSGRWDSDFGTAGFFRVTRHNFEEAPKSRKIFVVHGHDQGAKDTVARFLERLDLTPVILHEQPNRGQTLIEKFERNADVEFAVVLLTPDDTGYPDNDQGQAKPRARQNVILELGYFIGQLTRERVCTLTKGNVEIPSDINGVLYIPMDNAGAWKLELAAEIKQAGIDVDLNRAT